jgi:hypothetical protein
VPGLSVIAQIVLVLVIVLVIDEALSEASRLAPPTLGGKPGRLTYLAVDAGAVGRGSARRLRPTPGLPGQPRQNA